MAVKSGLNLFLGCLAALCIAAPAAAKSRPAGSKGAPVTDAETVVIPAGGTFEKLILVEARQQLQAEKARRILSFIPAGRLVSPVSVVIAQKGLAEKARIHTGSSAYVTRLADFSAPRLAVYDDRNPCIKDEEKNQDAKQPTMSVTGVPYLLEDPASTAEALLIEAKDLKKHGRGLSFADMALLQTLADKGYGLVRVTFKPGKQKDAMLAASVQIALDSAVSSGAPKTEVHGSREFLVERFFLGPETTEALPGIPLEEFPTGIELPHEASPAWPQAYNAWVAGVVKNANGVRRFAGPVNRCDVCYAEPLKGEALLAAGVFWTTDASARNMANLRVKSTSPAQTYDTWLTRHLMKKPAKAPLLIMSEVSPATVAAQFVEQGSVQRPFQGEIFCPAMDGYQKSLAERREKTIAAMNGWNGWNEKDLKDAWSSGGGTKTTWYQDHFQASFKK